MVTCIYLEEHPYLICKPLTINLGGKYLYNFIKEDGRFVVERKSNKQYIPGFFNIADSKCPVELLSAIVGENGSGKSTILDLLKYDFSVEYAGHNFFKGVILVEIEEETKILYSSLGDLTIKTEGVSGTTEGLTTLSKENKRDFQSIYYSPHYDLKYDHRTDGIDPYDISLDRFIQSDLDSSQGKSTDERGSKFSLNEELVLKNAERQIGFLSSSLFKINPIFKEVFDFPHYGRGVLYIREREVPNFNNTPYTFRPIITAIFEKLEKEKRNWHVWRQTLNTKDERIQQALINRYFLERNIVKALLTIIVSQMESRNFFLKEGFFKMEMQKKQIEALSGYDLFIWFINSSYTELGSDRKDVFKAEEVIKLIEKLHSLVTTETDSDLVEQTYIYLELDKIKDILSLHQKVITQIFHYYPKRDGLLQDSHRIDGFLAFRPTDKNLSSGENALLNFFSKLYYLIDEYLVEERKSLEDKNFYVLLLDEADLGFHPAWKKRFVSSILKTLPHFFESLKVQPKLQIIITTHDPLTLSDIPLNNVVFLQKTDGYCVNVDESHSDKLHKTFGANINELIASSFFIKGGLIGDFAKQKIDDTISWIQQNREPESRIVENFTQRLSYYKSVISLIDERVIRIKLSEMISELEPDNSFYNSIIDSEIEQLRKKKR